MKTTTPQKLLVTGATGQLGRLAIAELLKTNDPQRIVAAARKPEAARDIAALGVEIRAADYHDPGSLDAAFADIDRILFISSSEFEDRIGQHENVVTAAKRASVKRLVYTSILRADTSPLALAVDHKATEASIRDSGLTWVALRNGWYFENDLGFAPAAVESGNLIGSSGSGRISAAGRADFAEAAAIVLCDDDAATARIYELAGDRAYTRDELAAELSRQSGKAVAYHDMSPAEHEAALRAFLPPHLADLAHLLVDSDAGTKTGALYEPGRALGDLLGRPTKALADAVRDMLAMPARESALGSQA